MNAPSTSGNWNRIFSLISAFVIVSAGATAQQSTDAPLGLLRLRNNELVGKAPFASAVVSVDPLSPSALAGVRRSKRNNADYVSLDSGNEWSRSLRGAGNEVSFVSFQVFGSQSTVIEIAGAKFGITASDVVGFAQLMVKSGPDWRSLGLHLPFEGYEGKMLATLPVLTVRIDPLAGVFDIYSDARLLADNLPLSATEEARRFALTPGPDGAWITGLVQADENPLYADANANGIDDQFEQRKKGRILATNASAEERKQLAQEWRMDQMRSVPQALFFNRPRPDGK